MRKLKALVTVLLVAILANWFVRDCQAGAVDKDALRTLAKPPTLDLNFKFGPPTNSVDAVAVRAQVVNWQKQLKGDDTDAARYLQLGALFASLKNNQDAKDAYRKAAVIYKKQIGARPTDAALWDSDGAALSGLGQFDEAEQAYRTAVKNAPQDAGYEMHLGRHLYTQGFLQLFGFSLNDHPEPDFTVLMQLLIRQRPAAENAKGSAKLFNEAAACFDQCHDAESDTVDFQAERLMVRLSYSLIQAGVEIWDDHQPSQEELMRRINTPGLKADLAKLISNGSTNIDCMLIVLVAGGIQQADRGGQHPDLDKLIDDDLAQLTKLAQSPDPKLAYRAACATTALCLMTHKDYPATLESQARRIVALDPDNEDAWNMLIGLLLSPPPRIPEVLAVCQQRLAHKATVHNHLLVAKACEKLGQWKDSERHLQAAYELDPKNPAANLAVASVRLKNSRSEADLADAGQYLNRAEQAMDKDSPDGQKIALALLRAIHAGLRDDTETAEKYAAQALRLDPDNQPARDILKALGN